MLFIVDKKNMKSCFSGLHYNTISIDIRKEKCFYKFPKQINPFSETNNNPRVES